MGQLEEQVEGPVERGSAKVESWYCDLMVAPGWESVAAGQSWEPGAESE